MDRFVARLFATAVIAAAWPQHAGAQNTPKVDGWRLRASLANTYIQDLSFVSARVGFAAGGNGQVLRTTDGGATWAPVLDLGLPHYWYGVEALNAEDIVVSGFFDSSYGVQQALIRWSHDGGDSWSDDLVVSETDWANRVHFWNSSIGFATAITPSGKPNLLFRTTTGGLQLTDWTSSMVDPNGGWFGSQFSALPNGHVRMSGITYCESPDFAASWSCRPPVDPGTDWATFFLDETHGWVGGGGGSGYPLDDPMRFQGWIHVTADGGETWSGRTLYGPWPIKVVLFVNRRDGWAMGGGGDFGGAYVSHDGGMTWEVEFNAGHSLYACATADYHLFCAGYDDTSTSYIYERDFDHIRHGDFDEVPAP